MKETGNTGRGGRRRKRKGRRRSLGKKLTSVIWGDLELEVAVGLPREIDIQQAAGHLASSGERFRPERQIQGV